jgi:transcriptional regulator with XRE-family HTH domain
VGKQYRDQEYLELVGRKLVEIREKMGITQEKLAELTKFDTRQIGRIERAETNTSISMIKAIADKLDIGIDEILKIS